MSGVLVDTSVWVRFLADRAPYAAGLAALLSRDEVSGHPFVQESSSWAMAAAAGSCWRTTS